MCGIVGFINSFKGNFDSNKNLLKLMTQKLSHRGPDDEGYWCDKENRVFFGHKRLSIVDLSRNGLQPMISQDKNYIIIFNGEIYNHLELRQTITQQNNIYFKGHSDTETLIEYVSCFGIDKTLADIQGMYSMAIWNNNKKDLFLIRDIAGEKPLYYSFVNSDNYKSLVFASELKSIQIFPKFNKSINLNSIYSQQLFKYIPAPFSIFKDVKKVEPGTYLKISLDNMLIEKKRYWNLNDEIQSIKNTQFINSEKEHLNSIESSISQSVKDQLLGDVEIGCFLSGGVDSSLIASLMQSHSLKRIKTFTIGFNDNNYNEAKNAKEISNYLNTDHHEIYLSGKDILESIPNILKIYDEPFSDSSQIPTFLISKYASESVKVCLSGDGGDELFGGYNRYMFIERYWPLIKYLPFSMKKMLNKLILKLNPKQWDIFINKINSIINKSNNYAHIGDKLHKSAECLLAGNLEDLYQILISDYRSFDQKILKNFDDKKFIQQIENININNLNDNELVMIKDFNNYLPNDILHKVDMASMANSLETRLPYLSKSVIESAWKTPIDIKIKDKKLKYPLKTILSKYLPNKITELPKRGFSVPIGNMLRNELRDWAESYINKQAITKYDIFNYDFIEKKWLDHLSGRFNYESQIWSILIVQNWMEQNK